MDTTIRDFEAAIAELETIVKKLEEGDLALETSLQLYERGVQLSRFCHANSQSIYNCTYAPDSYKIPEGTKLTYNKVNGRLYVHVFDYPKDGKLTLPGYNGKIKYAQFLNDHSELLSKTAGQDVELTMPVKKPNYEIPVIELTLN